MDFVLYIAAMVYEAFFDGWANALSGPPLATPLFYSISTLPTLQKLDEGAIAITEQLELFTV